MRRLLRLALLPALTLLPPQAHAQAGATASRALVFSGFAGASAVSTGVNASRNLSITAGGDIAFHIASPFTLAAEFRATHPLDRGSVVAESNFLGGLRFGSRTHHLEPYGDLLVGRGSLDFGPSGYPDPHHPRTFYTVADGNAFAIGGGVLLRPERSPVALLADLQAIRYQTPTSSSGFVSSLNLSVGLRYTARFGFRRSR